MAQVYCISITYHDETSNQLLTIGGAGWTDQETWDHQWASIPIAPDDSAHCLAEKIDENGDIVDDQDVAIGVVEALFDLPISQLIEEARPEKG